MDKQSMEQLYKQYAKEVYLYAFSLCKDHFEAQELVSDTFFKALISLNKSDVEFKYWLFRVCKNLWLDGIKKKKYLSNNNIEDILTISEEDVLVSLIKDEEKLILYRAIQQLPQTYKEIITLYYFSNIQLKEISEIFNISSGAGRMLISRARRLLKELINREEFI